MHFPSVTRAPKKEASDPALNRLRKEMEEFHLAVGSDMLGKHRHGTEMDGTACPGRAAMDRAYGELLWQSHVNIESKY